MDRALPLLKSGYSLRFATILGGKDPDDILREMGADALRLQMSVSRPFSQAIFERERERDDLSTADQRAALKGRLRRLAQSIPDRDVSEQYGRDFLDRFYHHTNRRRYDGARPFDLSDRLRGLVDKTLFDRVKARMRTFNAAVAVAATENPSWAVPHVEDLAKFGFGDKRIADLVQPLIDCLYEAYPTHEMVLKHIKSDGAMACLSAAYRLAKEVDVYPFVGSKIDPQRAKVIWEKSFNVLVEIALVEKELEERHQAFVKREPIVDEAFLVERGPELRATLRHLAQAVS